jgi:hypothetical protein
MALTSQRLALADNMLHCFRLHPAKFAGWIPIKQTHNIQVPPYRGMSCKDRDLLRCAPESLLVCSLIITAVTSLCKGKCAEGTARPISWQDQLRGSTLGPRSTVWSFEIQTESSTVRPDTTTFLYLDTGTFCGSWRPSSGHKYSLLKKGKCKAVPLQTWSGPEGSRNLGFPDFLTTAQDGGKVVILTHRPHLPPGNTPSNHFC